MVAFRILTDEGVDMFRTFLDESARSGGSAPTHLLTDRNYSTEFSPKVHLQLTMTFKNKQIFGKYLVHVLEEAGVSRQMVSKNRNFWASIVLRYFDQFCPVDANGRRKVPMEKKDQYEKYPKFIPRYISSGSEQSLRGRRHYALGPYLIYDYNKNSEHQADVLLSGSLDSWGDDVEQTAGRIEVISNKNLIEVIRLLYWDEESSSLRRGYSTKTRPGNINRLVADLRNQMKLTADWYSMSANQIYDSLPEEYDFWKKKRGD
ncbi:MAG: hypothetical protein VW230_02020 [Candidatus Poseidoniales archaeon]